MFVPIYITLNNGTKVPILGLGTWKADADGEAYQAVKDAIDIGYRNFDCAWVYGNEREIGAAIRDKIKEGVVKREDLFISTKVWNDSHRPEDVLRACKTSLENFGLDYVDLYLVHWPMAFKESEKFGQDTKVMVHMQDYFPSIEDTEAIDFTDTWKGMEECQTKGLTKSIGLSNFNSKQIQRILDMARIKPVMNQVECHPYLNQSKLQAFCTSKGIALTGYSPFVSPGRPWATGGGPSILNDPVILRLAQKYNKSAGQIVLRWVIQQNIIVIPKSSNKSRLAGNINVFDFELDADSMEQINALNRNERIFGLEWYRDHPHYPFNEEF